MSFIYDKDEINSLLLRIRENVYDKDAFDELYRKISSSVYFIAKFHLMTEYCNQDIEDIVGETFARILEKIHKFREAVNGAGWIFKITENLCKKAKRNKRKEVLKPTIENTVTEAEDTQIDNIILGDILNKLDDQERAIIILHELHGLTYKEISPILSISVSTIYRRILDITDRFKKYKE